MVTPLLASATGIILSTEPGNCVECNSQLIVRCSRNDEERTRAQADANRGISILSLAKHHLEFWRLFENQSASENKQPTTSAK
eukprot:1790737-Pleurochrysis_carterae.AAC.1